MARINFKGIEEFVRSLVSGYDQLPIWGLPEDIQSLIESVAEGFKCPRDYCTASLLSAVSATRPDIKSRFLSFTNHPTTWFAIVGGASTGKSEPIKFFYRPILEKERESHRAYAKQKSEWESLPKKGRGAEPVFHHQLISNASDESVLKELAINGALTWKCDELRTTFESWGRYSQNGSGLIVSELLSIFDYDSHSITRVGAPPLWLDHPRLNIIGGIQPSVLKRTLSGKGYTEDGLFQRFLFVFPEPRKIPYLTEKAIEPSLYEAWGKKVDDLRNHDQPEEEPFFLTEVPEARKLHLEKLKEWTDRANSSDDEVVKSLIQKFGYHLCRLSMVVAILHQAVVIRPAHIRYASELCECLIRHSLKVLRLVSEKDESKTIRREDVAKLLIQWNPSLSQSEIAKALGISQQAVSKYFS